MNLKLTSIKKPFWLLRIFKKKEQDFLKIEDKKTTKTQEINEGPFVKLQHKNPWLDARQTWNDHVGSIISQRDTWRLVGLLSLLITLCSVAGMIILSSRSKLVPYVVEVDRLGHTLALGALAPSSPVDPRILHAAIADFITNARTVSPDAGLQRQAIFRVYAFIDSEGPALQKMNAWLNATPTSNPFVRATKEMVSIQIRSILPLSKDNWQVDWEETILNRQGIVTTSPFTMRAVISVRFADFSENVVEEILRNNPMGILVTDFSWSKTS